MSIYAFFGPIPDITYNAEGHRAHEFRCSASVCKGRGVNGQIVWCFLDTMDQKSTSNLIRHATVCWGAETVDQALDAKVDIKSARKTLGNLKDGSVTTAFERKGKERERFRTHITSTPKCRPGENDNRFRFFVLTMLDSAEIVCWVSESMQPFSIIEDRGFLPSSWRSFQESLIIPIASLTYLTLSPRA